MTGVKRAQTLRDFFFSVHGREMAAAVSQLEKVSFPAPEVTDWEAVEYDFNRLFVGPMALEAPPYASFYLDPEPLLMDLKFGTPSGKYEFRSELCAEHGHQACPSSKPAESHTTSCGC